MRITTPSCTNKTNKIASIPSNLKIVVHAGSLTNGTSRKVIPTKSSQSCNKLPINLPLQILAVVIFNNTPCSGDTLK